MDPLVTICVTTYNRKNLLLHTVTSLLNQSYSNLEVIIIDDCSTDQTDKFIQNEQLFRDKRIRYIRFKENKGLAKGRNRAIKEARGKYFTFCDDDDEFLPDLIESFVKAAESSDEKWCFVCGHRLNDLEGNELDFTYVDEEMLLKDAIKMGYTPPVASQFYHTSLLKRLGGYDEKIKSGVDHDLWLKLSYNKCKIRFLSDVLSKPNSNNQIVRMTNLFEHRVLNIKESLKIWERNIVENYGKKFFITFSKEYKFYIFKSFMSNYYKSKRIHLCFKLIFLERNFFFLTRIIREGLLKPRNLKHKEYKVIIKPLFNMR